MAGQVEDLPGLGECIQNFFGPAEVFFVQIYKGIVQDQRRLFSGEEAVRQSQVHT